MPHRPLHPVAAGLVMLLVVSCGSNGSTSSGSGPIVTKRIEVSSFSRIEVGGPFLVNVSVGDHAQVVLRVPQDVEDHVDVGVSNGRLRIGLNAPTTVQNAMLRADVTARGLSGIEARGASRVHVSDELSGTTLDLELAGAVRLDASVRFRRVNATLSGDSQMRLAGRTDRFVLKGAGGDRVDAEGLRSSHLVADLSGATQAIVSVSDTISATLLGACSLRYRGSPRFTRRDVDPTSSIRKV